MRQRIRAILLVAASCVIGSNAVAQQRDGWQFRQILVDNDLFALPQSQYGEGDRFYSNGIRVAFGNGVHRPGGDDSKLPFWVRPVRRHCAGCEIVADLTLGHQINTPEDLENPDLQPSDWPWSAWLYAGFGAAIDTPNRSRHNVEIQVGVTGDAALGKLGQEFWHEFTGSPTPRGWDHQLGPDLGINGYYEFQHILWESAGGRRLDWDFVPSIKAAVGTMQSYIGAGGTVRFGRNISDFPYSTIRAAERAPSAVTLRTLEVYGFTGLAVKAVGYNYFLEGSLFRDDPYRLDPKRYVWDFTVGATARFPRFNITYAIVRQSRQFVRNIGLDRGIHVYGTLSLTVGIR